MNSTEIVFILDRSGSMGGLEKDTIGGFNSMLKKQKGEAGKAIVSTVLFDDESVVLHDRVDIKDVPAMTAKDYSVGGCTALLDAVGSAIEHISKVRKTSKKKDIPEKTLFVITTDGMENASCRFDYAKVKKMIEARKKKGWEFLFMGANIDAAKEAARFGISRDMAADYHADEKGTKVIFDAMSTAVLGMRTGKAIAGKWKSKIDKDFKERSGK